MTIDLSTLVGSRIGHDLANPLGAIGNGLELLTMSAGPSEEMSLIQDALSGALAKLSLYRLAFGEADKGQVVSGTTLARDIAAFAQTGRHTITWNAPAQVDRLAARTVVLAILCAQTALPLGGQIEVDADMTLRAQGRQLTLDPALWEPLRAGRLPEVLTGGTVHFGLLPGALAAAGRSFAVQADGAALTIRL